MIRRNSIQSPVCSLINLLHVVKSLDANNIFLDVCFACDQTIKSTFDSVYSSELWVSYIIMRKNVSRSWSCDVEIEDVTKLFRIVIQLSSSFFYLFTFFHHFHLLLHDVFLIITTMNCNTKYWTSKVCFWHDSTRFWDFHHVVNFTYVVKWSRFFMKNNRILSSRKNKWYSIFIIEEFINNYQNRFFCETYSSSSSFLFSFFVNTISYFVIISYFLLQLLLRSCDHIVLILSRFFFFFSSIRSYRLYFVMIFLFLFLLFQYNDHIISTFFTFWCCTRVCIVFARFKVFNVFLEFSFIDFCSFDRDFVISNICSSIHFAKNNIN